MSQLVRYEVRDGVAVITADNPPVNALGAGVPEAISEAVGRACHDAAADAIVLIGAGTTFIAGADISVFRQLKTRQQSIERSQAVHRRLTQLEDAAKPLVAAIHGHALGGGLEFAMACHYRVAAATARVGQPEVNLGIIPGAGGTQRLPRLCGVSLALEMCTDGKPVAANRAREGGIVDAVIDGDLRQHVPRPASAAGPAICRTRSPIARAVSRHARRRERHSPRRRAAPAPRSPRSTPSRPA
jgi:3-hydroxyacyl-CoA dehydrogenase